jgi:hypothetical protein
MFSHDAGDVERLYRFSAEGKAVDWDEVSVAALLHRLAHADRSPREHLQSSRMVLKVGRRRIFQMFGMD